MNVKFRYILICLNIILINFGTGLVISKDGRLPSEVRIKRQAGYVYDKPTVSFDLPTATPIATQAPTVDRTQMQMYYAYPVPAGDTSAVQNTGSTAGSTAVSGANGYSYGVQNTQVTDSRTTVTQTQTQAQVSSGSGYGDGRPTSTSNTGYQSTGVTGTQVSTGSGYGDGRPTTATNTGYQTNTVTGTQTVVSSGGGYGDGRPTNTARTNTGSTGVVSTSAPRYLPPTRGQNTVTSNQAQTSVVTKPADSYIPPVQATPQNEQTVVTQTTTNAGSSPANPNTSYLVPNPQVTQTTTNAASPPANPTTSYLVPNPQPAPNVPNQPGPMQPVQNVPTQQYLPPLETSGGQKTIQGTVAAPAATYLPPVF